MREGGARSGLAAGDRVAGRPVGGPRVRVVAGVGNRLRNERGIGESPREGRTNGG